MNLISKLVISSMNGDPKVYSMEVSSISMSTRDEPSRVNGADSSIAFEFTSKVLSVSPSTAYGAVGLRQFAHSIIIVAVGSSINPLYDI